MIVKKAANLARVCTTAASPPGAPAGHGGDTVALPLDKQAKAELRKRRVGKCRDEELEKIMQEATASGDKIRPADAQAATAAGPASVAPQSG